MFFVPYIGATTAGIYVQVPDTGVDFLIDSASAQELAHNSHWLSDAQKRINSIRKAPVTFKLVTNHFNFQKMQKCVTYEKNPMAYIFAVSPLTPEVEVALAIAVQSFT